MPPRPAAPKARITWKCHEPGPGALLAPALNIRRCPYRGDAL